MQPPAQMVKGKENQEPKEQQHSYNPNPWYSLLSCRLLSFIGGGGQIPAEHEEVRNTARTVISSHRLSAERRFSESSMHSIRCAPTSHALTSVSPAVGREPHCHAARFSTIQSVVQMRLKGPVPAASTIMQSANEWAKTPLLIDCPVTWILLGKHLTWLQLDVCLTLPLMHAAFSLDGGDSPSVRSARNSMTRRRLPSNLRRTAHEFARDGAYDRDTSFYSEMAVEAPQTSIRGLSTSLDRSGNRRLSSSASPAHTHLPPMACTRLLYCFALLGGPGLCSKGTMVLHRSLGLLRHLSCVCWHQEPRRTSRYRSASNMLI